MGSRDSHGAPPDAFPNFMFFNVPKDMPGIGNDVRDISGAAIVDGVRCFVAMFGAADAKMSMRCVMLPGPGKSSPTPIGKS